MKALTELMAHQRWMIHDLVDSDQVDDQEERELLQLTEQAAQDLARITAENIAYKKVCDGKTPEEMAKWIDVVAESLIRTSKKIDELTRDIRALKQSS